jgi:hypothetical protein
MGILGGIVKPVANIAQKAATAGKLKSIKLKVKMAGQKDQKKADGTKD